eukprot:13737862-Ditylum_brightwellii.AAC.1
MAHTTNNILDKQVRKVFALKHSMFASDRLLFGLDLTKQLRSSPESKRLWLKAVKIAVQDFTHHITSITTASSRSTTLAGC